MDFELILIDQRAALCDTWKQYFADLPRVRVVNDRFENVAEFDCMVSPANSFGLMDGGIDAAITRFFGGKIMSDVQAHIIREFLGEQPVGTAFVIGTGHPQHPWLVHAPTMRVPMEISRTDNVYLAMWAMLRAVHHHNLRVEARIETVLCPGLGTGAGHVPPREAARQMALAYRNYLNRPQYLDWNFANQRQADVRYGGDMGFNFPPVG